MLQPISRSWRRLSRWFPDFNVDLPSRPLVDGPAPGWYFDITALQKDTGFVPQFAVETGIADYIAWLRSGNER